MSTAQGTFLPTTRTPWLRRMTARLSPSACATAWPSATSVIISGVSSKTPRPSQKSTESWVSSSSVAPVAANAVTKGGWPWTTAPTSGRAL